MIKESNRFFYQNNLQEKFFIFINKFLLCFENSSMGCTKTHNFNCGFFLLNCVYYIYNLNRTNPMKRHFLPLLFLISSVCSSQSQKKTISDYDKLIKYNPTDMSNYYNRGLLKVDEVDFTGAISDFDIVVENDEKNINALYNRALAKAEINDTNGAIRDLSKILKFDSNNSDVYFKRSFLNASVGNKGQACLDAKKASSLGSLDAESLISMLCN